MEEEQKPDFWFVLRDMKCPNAHNSGYLSLLEMPELQGDLFIPLKQMIYNHFGKRIIKQIPLYQDLIFFIVILFILIILLPYILRPAKRLPHHYIQMPLPRGWPCSSLL